MRISLEMPTFIFLQMAKQLSYISLTLIFTSLIIPFDADQSDFSQFNSTRWMEIGHNSSGIEW